MKIRGIIMLLIIMIILILFSYGDSGINKLSMGFEKSGGTIKKIDIEGSSKILSKMSSKDIVINLYKYSELGRNYKVEIEDDGAQLISNNLIIKVKKLSPKNLNYASFTISHYSNMQNINNIRRSISKGFYHYHVKPSFSFLIEGKYKGKMTLSEMKKKGIEILSSSGSEYIDVIDDGNVVSLVGFIPRLKEKIKVMNRYLNLNIALRYSKQNYCTYIFIGSPIISTEY